MSRRDPLGLDPRALRLVLIGGLLVVAAAAWQLVLREQLKSYRTVSEVRSASAEAVAREGVDAAAVAAAEAALARLEERLYGGAPEVPASRMASHVIARLDALAGEFRVRLAGVKPGARAEVLGFTEVPFDVQVEGDYPRLMGWLGRVEDELRPMVVKRFRIEPLADAGLLRMELRVASYRAPSVP